uniref:PUA domain-containing protein n=1 Tax=Octactis speculum TaxID=3111310 RepID=A0A7S2FAF8_9STRA|mmetsp:Transcript_18561/g.25189  ORF Transcript_18561/g.25189 Transcript_18561/m.25189 type:complete len:191 (+) Transcript_18561:64-636(+)|eukprot:CAMPEP_0185775790 /NCGR_PEP_ID=MMETSP1174-20130828/83300_1 /TAXON_ID=35687 /ORGANISM="Dictyocha speculum, Strain CCMP1381" /LENGTH=190 /DNA_ID=CAMNT_0028463477 /DNA_START=52 /DNA_END=624 /DNA_ORIENTATION=-
MSSQSQPLFKRYDPEDFVSSQSQCKSSVARAIRAKLIQDYPALEEVLEELIPKKQPLTLAKAQNHLQLLVDAKGQVLFFQQRDSSWYPVLRLVHRFPNFGPIWQVDKGAIKHILGGANIFGGGLISGGGQMNVELQPGQPVIIMAEGKRHACCIGLVKKSPDDIRAGPRGVAVENLHYLNDGLWISPDVN